MVLKTEGIPSTHNHTMPTHTQHKTTWCTLTPQNLLQTVPHAAHKMYRNFKINGVTSID